jgi:hypothetical protein
MSKQSITEEERKRRSELAKKMHKDGVFGGAGKGQGRKKKETANEKASREAARNSQKIVDAIIDALENGKPGEKLKAAQLWLEIEAREIDRKVKQEHSQLESASKDELIKFIIGKMSELKASGLEIPNFDIDANAEEIKPKQIAPSNKK